MRFLILTTAILASIVSSSLAAKPAAPAQVKVEQAEKQLAEGAQILDVRTQGEWDEGHLKDAKFVCVTEGGFLDKAKTALDPKKPVLVYCKSGKRSVSAAKQLRDAGYVVYDLEGGIVSWMAAGKPVVK